MPWSTFRELMLRDLSLLLGCGVAERPAVFQTERAPNALKLQVCSDLAALYPNTDRTELRRWFTLWTGRAEYQRALCFDRCRYDLHGNNVGEISPAHREYARVKLVANRPKPVTWISSAPSSITPVAATRRRQILHLPSLQKDRAA